MASTRITVSFPQELYEQLQLIAQKEQRTLSQTVVVLVRNSINSKNNEV